MLDAKLTDSLIKTLQYEMMLYGKILTLAERKTDYLVMEDTTSLSDLTREENLLAEQAQQLNKLREQLIGKIAVQLGKESTALKLDDVKGLLPEERKTEISGIQAKLKNTVISLHVRNGINQKLIENALKYVEFNLQLLASPMPVMPLYGKSGHEVEPDAKISRLDIKY